MDTRTSAANIIEMKIGSMSVFNYALYENGVSPIRGIKVKNNTKDILSGLFITVESDSDFLTNCQIPVPSLPVGKWIELNDPMITINGKYLAEITEAFTINVEIAISNTDQKLYIIKGQMNVLAYDQWPGDDWDHLLPAYCMPNHPVVMGLIHDAAIVLKSWGKEQSLEGYQKNDPNRVRDLAAAVFTAIQNKNVVYSNPPAHAGALSYGQRIRTPESVMDQHLATCMDFTMLYASCLEAIGLFPVLCLVKSHIFAGVWLKEECGKDIVTRDNGKVIKLMTKGNEKVSFVECTAMAAESKLNYEQAEYKPEDPRFDKEEFNCLVDVESARREGIRSIAARFVKDGRYIINSPERKADEMSSAPTPKDFQPSEDIEIHPLKPKKIDNKKELWENKLLDLSLHNMLINLPDKSSSIEPIMSVHVDELENALSDGEEFSINPVPDRMCFEVTVDAIEGKKKKQIKLPWCIAAMLNSGGPYEMTDWVAQLGEGKAPVDFTDWLKKEAKSHRLYSFLPEKELEKNLTKIYRAAKSSQQENGVSSLYMSIGVLRWLDEEKNETHHAPLILVPIEIERKSANQGYALHMRDEEPHMNLTVLEMLKENYNIEIAGLDPLPADDNGVDVRKIFSIIRSNLKEIGHWDVVETCAIGNFSFAQFAMWNDMRQSDEILERSKIVRSLMIGKVDWEIPAEESWQDDETLLPISVDDTQLQAIKMANHGQTFVLHGPPGTGKSQTITSMIANLAAHGKRVLFVAEKMAALSVVEKRLTSIGIGDFCLELHSDKANKKHVLSQLEKAMTRQRLGKDREFEETLKQIKEERKILDDYSAHLHKVYPCGYSVHQLIDMYEQASAAPRMINFDSDEVETMTREKIKSHRSLLGKLVAAGNAVGDIRNHPLKDVSLDIYSPTMRFELQGKLKEYEDIIHRLKTLGERIANAYGLVVPTTLDQNEKNCLVIDYWNDLTEQLPNLRIYLSANPENVRKAILSQEKYRKEKEKILQIWKPSFLNKNIQEYIDRYNAAQKKLIGGKKQIVEIFNELQSYACVPLRSEKIPELCKDAIAFQKMTEQAEKEENAISAEDRALLALTPSVSKLDELIKSMESICEEASKYPGGFENALTQASKPEVSADREEYFDVIDVYHKANIQFNESIHRYSDWDKLEDELKFIEWLRSNASQLKDWALYNHIKSECSKAGLDPVIRAYENGMPSEELYGAYRKGLCLALINGIMSQDEVLGTFTGSSFDEIVRQFKETDDRLLELTKKEIERSLILQAWTIQTEYVYEANRLRKAIKSNARGMSIRNVFESMPNVIPAICPVMLMSPNSVAQYLQRKNDLFDIVIFDEASQLPTCKAIGALVRAKDAVIVGDPKQMPPTSFFAGSGPVVENIDLDDLDSILDDALALGIPSKYLQWHYRSKHESLIAFSNHQFYENKMFTFPSANDRERHVIAVHVDGVYKKNVNQKEAESVVAEIIRRYRDPELKKQSIGVVTFNVKQQDLIYNLLAKQYQGDPELDAWANGNDDPIFIKNLENVQGDERDVILFSIGYGPDEKGKISMNFGPINKAGGGKRLNVAFSRARITMMIFSSLYSSQIKVTEVSPEGLIAFHDFLRYAEGNDLQETVVEVDEDDIHDGILTHIRNAIQKQGYECEVNIGHSDFHVDIAVIDPYHPDEYLMGILLDGEQYRNTKNTRDREVSQSSVLSRLGWNLVRVWTIDWWDDADRQTKRLIKRLDALKEKARIRAEEEKAKSSDVIQDTEEEDRLKKELEKQAAEVLADEEQDTENNAVPEISVATTEKAPESEPSKKPSEENSQSSNPQVIEDKTNDSEPVSADISPNQPEERPTETDQKPESNETNEPADYDPSVEIQTDIPEPNVPTKPDDTKPPVEQLMMDVGICISVVDYHFADLPETDITPAEFASSANKKELLRRAELLLNAEAPIQKDAFIRKLVASFGVTKQSLTVDAVEKALKAIKAKNTKLKGNVFCWRPDQDPKSYALARVTSERKFDELPPQEIKNALCYLLNENGVMNRDDLISAASRLLGYQRLGKNLEGALIGGLTYAKTNGDVIIEGQAVKLGNQTSPLLYLQKHAFDYVDMTDRGGCLYFFDAEAAAFFKEQGYHVSFAPNGTKSTENRPCWYISSR